MDRLASNPRFIVHPMRKPNLLLQPASSALRHHLGQQPMHNIPALLSRCEDGG
ncbi:MAG: hypothetical protein ACI9D0_001192 [Bacteroidia bacterium]|jgi:hypothetical protein